MPVHWSLLPESKLCIVTGRGKVTRADIEAYLAGTIREGAKSYAKLVDATACILALDHDDLESVAHDLVQHGWGERPGPVAIIVDTASNLDMAALMKPRVEGHPFRIFTSSAAARDWPESHVDSYRQFSPDDAFPTAGGPRPRPLRAS